MKKRRVPQSALALLVFALLIGLVDCEPYVTDEQGGVRDLAPAGTSTLEPYPPPVTPYPPELQSGAEVLPPPDTSTLEPYPPPRAPKPPIVETATPSPPPPTPRPTPTLMAIYPTPFEPSVPLPKSFRQVTFAFQPAEMPYYQPLGQPISLWQLDHDAKTGRVMERQLALPDMGYFAWWKISRLSGSPDGRYIAINARTWEGGGSVVWIVSADGSKAVQVGIPGHETETVFLDWVPGTDRVLFKGALSYLWGSTDVGGSSYQELPLHDIEDAAVSPDGREIVFSWAQKNIPFGFVNMDEAVVDRIFTPTKQAGLRLRNFVWSPDGQKIAYTWDKIVGIYGDGQLWLMDADGNNQKQLSPDEAYDFAPSWSSDSTTLAYVRRENPTDIQAEYGPSGLVSSIWVMDVACGVSRELVKSEGKSHWAPTWLPDGSAILFISSRGGADDVWIVNADGSGLQQLTFHGYVVGGLVVAR